MKSRWEKIFLMLTVFLHLFMNNFYFFAENNSAYNETGVVETKSEQEQIEQNFYIIGQTENGDNIYSSVDKNLQETEGSWTTFDIGHSSGSLSWQGMYFTPLIWITGIGYVYCSEPYESFPNGDWYDEGTWLKDKGLDALLAWGFPRNHGGQFGLSDNEAYVRTYVALNAYIGNFNRSTVESFGDSYVNMLLHKADTKDYPDEVYTIHEPTSIESKYNAITNRLETDLYHITGSSGTFWIENLPTGFYLVGEENQVYTNLSIGSKFRIVTENLNYTGTINFDVKTDIAPSGAIRFTAPGVQKLLTIKRRDPLSSQKSKAIFKAAMGKYAFYKNVIQNAEAVVEHDKTTVKIKVWNKDFTYNKEHTVRQDGTTEEYEVLLGNYFYEETHYDTSMNPTTSKAGKFDVAAGQSVIVTIDNTTAKGNLSIEKVVNQLGVVPVVFDLSEIEINVKDNMETFDYNKNFSLSSDGNLTIQGLPRGWYNITETKVPYGMEINKTVHKVFVEDELIKNTAIIKITNSTTIGTLKVVKELQNPTSDLGNKQYNPTDSFSVIQVHVKSLETNFTYNKVHNLNNSGVLELQNLPVGKYEVQEVFVPGDMEINNTKHTVIIKSSENQQITILHIKNTLKKSRVQIGKKDDNDSYVANVNFIGGSSLLKDTNGNPSVWTYDVIADKEILAPSGQEITEDGKYYYRVDESSKLFDITTGSDGKAMSEWFLYGYKVIYVQEISASKHLMLNKTVKAVTLIPNDTVYIEFLNIIKEPLQIQVQKKDELGEFVSWYFKVFMVNLDETETYMETIVTSELNGIGNSTLLQAVGVDKQNKHYNIKYKVCEQEHPLYRPQECKLVTKDNANSNTSLITISMMNIFKEVFYSLPKVAETNPYNLNVEGASFEIFDNVTKVVYANGVVHNEQVIFSAIRVDKILENDQLYYREKQTNEAFVLDEGIYKIPKLTKKFLETYTSNTPISLKEKEQPLINKLKTPSIQTYATTMDEQKFIKPNQNVKVVDKVTFKNLIPQKEYVIQGVIMNKQNNLPLLINNQEITAELIFTPKCADGVVDVIFEFTTNGLVEGQDLVLFETIFFNNQKIVSHTDINDLNQTLTIRNELVAAGIQNNIAKAILILTLSTFCFCLLFMYKYYKTNQNREQ